MYIKDLIGCIFEDVCIYKENTGSNYPYKDIYIGSIENVSDEIKCMSVASIGVSNNGYLDIKAK